MTWLPTRRASPSAWPIVVTTFVWLAISPQMFVAQTNEASVRLIQGLVVGIKVFPEYSRTPVFTFMGIPYAQPPMNELRFAPPVAHVGWNRTLYARNFQAICPQPELNVYEESTSGYLYQSRMSENCLFLNVWTPENCLRYGKCPMLVVISGEEQTFDWARNRPTGLDLAVDGVVVITVQSRTNIFGWLTTGHPSAPGNLGLLDQQLALRWVQVNGPKFGGSPEQVTLLGHGTSGATNAMIHLAGLGRRSTRYFSRMIVMSGSLFSPWSFQVHRNPASPSSSIIRNLACESTNPNATLICLRQKSVSDLLNAFWNVYKNGNYTTMLGPQVDWYLEKTDQLLSRDPRFVISQHNYTAIPMLIGICSNEGAFMRDYWLDLSREGYAALNKHVQQTQLPNILHHYGFTSGASEQIRQTINWRFFDQIPPTIPHLLDAMQRLQSEAKFERPFFETIEIMSRDNISEETIVSKARLSSVPSALTSPQQRSSDDVVQLDEGVMEHRAFADLSSTVDEHVQSPPAPLFVYSFRQGQSMDLRGRTNYFGGAGHTADLLFLMGPSLFQQIGRRKMSQSEERLCKKMRRYFVDFVKTGSPTPGRLFDAWLPYKSSHKFVQFLGEQNTESKNEDGYLDRNQLQIAQMLSGDNNDVSNGVANNAYPYSIDNSRIDTSAVPKSYLPDPNNSPYYLSLAKVASFWDELLPKMMRNNNVDGTSDPSRQDLAVADPTSSKFRHAFFSMLGLVCLLLAILGVCLYILQRNRQTIDTSYL